MPTMSQVVTAYQAHVHPDRLLDDVALISSVDRLQGSTGLNLLAADIADRLTGLGLHTCLREYPPGHRWWSFTAPAAPSPQTASLKLTDSDLLVTSYPAQSCSLARGSASTHPRHLPVALLGDDPRGALVVCPPQPRYSVGPLISGLHARGAVAIAIESPTSVFGRDVVARLEVADHCPLVAFSISTNQATRLRAARGHHVQVTAEHTPPADMPLVLARHPGQPNGPRALLTAHLCHPAPSTTAAFRDHGGNSRLRRRA